MKNSEESIIELLINLEHDILSVRSEIISHKNSLQKAESKLIEKKLLFEKYSAALKSIKDKKIPIEKNERQIEIEEFKKRLPEIMKILENNTCQKKK